MATRAQPVWTATLVVFAFLSTGLYECESQEDIYAEVDPYRQVHPAFVEPTEGTISLRYRNIDGTGNHSIHFDLGAAHTPLRRIMPDTYEDQVSAMAGTNRPNPRVISNVICAEETRTVNSLGATDFLWQWGQFLDHDIDLTSTNAPFHPQHIRPETGDEYFDPDYTGLSQIDFFRSSAKQGTGIDHLYPRQQMNTITHFIDASNVYGSDDERALALRTNDGTGRLKVSAGNLLPFNTEGLENEGGANNTSLFLAGDIRANEHIGLTAMHTLFVREHNRLAAEIAANDPTLSGEEIYQEARRFVGALMQGITYNEFIPALLGPDALEPYTGYDLLVSPCIINSFSSAAYRFGHSAVSDQLLRLDASGATIPFGNLPLMNAFFAPYRIINEGGIEPILRGLATQEMSAVDVKIVEGLRNFLFGDPTAGGLDLASLNIQRGRDHGLPDFKLARRSRGIANTQSFADITSNPEAQMLLEATYGTVEDIDLWVGGIAQDPVNGGHVGELFFHILKTQFENLRDGDRYWYQWALTAAEIAEIDSTTLADVIRRNTTIDTEIDDDVFHVN